MDRALSEEVFIPLFACGARDDVVHMESCRWTRISPPPHVITLPLTSFATPSVSFQLAGGVSETVSGVVSDLIVSALALMARRVRPSQGDSMLDTLHDLQIGDSPQIPFLGKATRRDSNFLFFTRLR
jgi:hypothetical protein